MLNELMKKRLSVVRVGLPVRMHSEVRAVCLQSHIESHSANKDVHSIEQRIKQISEELAALHSKRSKASTPSIRRAQRNKKEKLSDEKQKLLSKKERMLEDMRLDILLSADVVCATCIGCGNEMFASSKDGKLQFCLILVDEASQTLEPSVLIPLLFSCRYHGKLVMIGDQKQLRPMIASPEARKYGFDETLFDRLIDAVIDSPLFSSNLLSTQYRMHPDIAQWPNSVVYDNQITNAQSAHSLKAFDIPGFVWPNKKMSDFYESHESPLLFIDVFGKECKQKTGFSVSNLDEAAVVVKILQNVIECNADSLQSIGVITGYNAQRAAILEKLKDLYGENAHEILEGLEVESVDGFQGREKDLIILSCVRSNGRNEIGFMRDERRMNVALTRARRGLIVVGNAKCLAQSDKLWQNFIAFMRNSARIVGKDHIDTYLKM